MFHSHPPLLPHIATLNNANKAFHSIFTTRGTLVGVDDRVHMPTERSFAALVGLTWRRHVAEIEGRGSPSVDVQHVKTLRLMHKPGGLKQLKSMIVEWEGMVAAVEEIKKDVLLSAQRPLSEFIGEEDALGKRLARLALESKRDDGEHGDDGMGREGGKVPKIRILELRAQGMAEAIALEWPGPLPDGYY